MAKPLQGAHGGVILAADAGSYSAASVSLAVAMAATAGGLLQALFVEDEDLLQVSGLPGAREITLITATSRSTSSEQVQRSLRLVARQFRQTLQQEAQALQVSWSFDTMRGRVRDLGLKPAVDATYTILAHSALQRLRSVQQRGARRILLLGKSSAAQQTALEALAGLYAREPIELTLGDEDGAGERFDAALWARQQHRSVSTCELSLRELLDQLGSSGSKYDCAILSGLRSGEDMALLLKSLRCPVILIA
jgi:hypothetical protein